MPHGSACRDDDTAANASRGGAHGPAAGDRDDSRERLRRSLAPLPPGAPARLPIAWRLVSRPSAFAPGIATGREVRIEELRSMRRERVEEGGRRVIIEEPGNRVIIRENGREFIRHDETERFRRAYVDADVRVERRGEEQITIVRRPNGVEVVTVRDADGNLIRRVRRDPRGTETVLIENVIAGRPRTRTVIEEVWTSRRRA